MVEIDGGAFLKARKIGKQPQRTVSECSACNLTMQVFGRSDSTRWPKIDTVRVTFPKVRTTVNDAEKEST